MWKRFVNAWRRLWNGELEAELAEASVLGAELAPNDGGTERFRRDVINLARERAQRDQEQRLAGL